MFTLEELFSRENQNRAMENLKTKKDGKGSDGILLSELEEYWLLNKERVYSEIEEGVYVPGVVKCFEIINNIGKRRIVSNLCTLDRFIGRLLAQKMEEHIGKAFLENSYAYREGKGTLEAVTKAKEYMESGKRYVAVIDIKNYFDCIPLDRLMILIRERIRDERLQKLLYSYLFCKEDLEGHIYSRQQGILQGSPISPLLSNLYLHSLDEYMEERKYCWIRFSDNIYVYTEEEDIAAKAYEDIYEQLKKEYRLPISEHKSGVFEAVGKGILGYDFIDKNGRIEIIKHQYQKSRILHYWNPSVIQKYNQEYHIINDGILTKKDYSLLFENDSEKHHIPVEVVQQINFYSDVIISTNVLKTLSDKQIRASFYDKFGNLVGTFVPEKVRGDGGALLRQCEIYNDNKLRLDVARQMELASVHNMRANIRYYNKKKDLTDYVEKMNESMRLINEGKTIEQLRLIEARARQDYYHVFNEILDNENFFFEKRTKRPPKDALNSMISFGNTLLYNQFLQFIWKTPLEPRIGMVHATNRRAHSLNLDFADIFKPIIVDRIIFKLINCKQIRLNEHFQMMEDGGVYLSKNGKRVFLTEFQQKINSQIVIKGQVYTYLKLMEQEVHQFYSFIADGEKYRPYKYY